MEGGSSHKKGCASNGETNNDGFVQFWDRAFNIFFCAYSGRRFKVYNVFSCAYSGRKEIYSFVQFWDGVYNVFSCAYSGRRF